MSIQLTCACGKSLKAKDELAGKRVKCPGCGAAFPVPSRQVPAQAPVEGKGPARGHTGVGQAAGTRMLGPKAAATEPAQETAAEDRAGGYAAALLSPFLLLWVVGMALLAVGETRKGTFMNGTELSRILET
jgi:hypothetical protein